MIDNIITWLNTCSYITVLDISQTPDGGQGLYKQAGGTTEDLIDGSQIRTDYYYILFGVTAKLKKSRKANENLLQNFEDWVYAQDLAGTYPTGACGAEITNTHYMQDRDNNDAVYQVTLAITYIYGGGNND